MSDKKAGPFALGRGDTGLSTEHPQDRLACNVYQATFPLCELFGLRIVRQLPPGCALRSANPLFAAHAYTERGYERLAPGPDRDTHGALRDFAIGQTCGRCVGRLIGHPTITKLRAAPEGGDA